MIEEENFYIYRIARDVPRAEPVAGRSTPKAAADARPIEPRAGQ
jgi:hypothetical protein